MKRSHLSTTIALTAASFFALAASANASDLDNRAELYEPAPAGTSVNWTGVYVGAQVGGSQAVIGDEDGSGGLATSGFLGGGRVGYDQAMGRFLIGAFGDYNWSNAALEVTPLTLLEKDSEWTVGARAGVIVTPHTLAYALGGYTEAKFSAGSESETFDGWTAGGGIEFAVTNNLALGMEASHTWYDEGEDAKGISFDDTRVMGTLKIKLNSF